jgi:hypothetical protein
MKQINEAFSQEESSKIYDNFLAIVNDKKCRDRLVSKHGKNAEAVAYGTAVNQVKKQAANKIAEPTTEEPMEDNKLKEMVKAALSKPLDETNLGHGEISSITPEGGSWIVSYRTMDGKKEKVFQSEDEARKFASTLNEDLDLGHQDDEPHMIKAELAHIAKYAIELYKMVDQFEGPQEVDFPAWWQSKITTARNMISSAKHYLEFELEEPKIDAMVDVASEEGALDESALDDRQYRDSNNIMRGAEDLAKNSKDVESYKEKWYKIYSQGPQDKDPGTDKWLEGIYARMMKKGAIDEEMTPEKSRKKGMPFKDKIKEAILAKLKNK